MVEASETSVRSRSLLVKTRVEAVGHSPHAEPPGVEGEVGRAGAPSHGVAEHVRAGEAGAAREAPRSRRRGPMGMRMRRRRRRPSRARRRVARGRGLESGETLPARRFILACGGPRATRRIAAELRLDRNAVELPWGDFVAGCAFR